MTGLLILACEQQWVRSSTRVCVFKTGLTPRGPPPWGRACGR